ncbi:F0F1 ATP synthase subunit A [Hufsiella ginkgonis]|uniref:ATP synthase subunit a n=1 Tax=Hufsiella ginkgonis TaxID=2695274 RepID=A0A7K1Y2V3_9SPHI|nr:F0F1 ATP synthase subunit A [Hufsiella ginkgonis]MXV17590.1 F0F1 ATP synthase subunit A [Hufsiella ginkgonis]
MDLSHIFNLKKIAITAFCAVFLVAAHAQEHENTDSASVEPVETETGHADKEAPISETILHHIADSHEWHFWGEGEHKVAIPLPVILVTKNGIVTFLSNKHDQDEHGKEVFEEKGQQLVNFHGGYYYPTAAANHEGEYVVLDQYKVPTNEKPLDLSITKNVASMLISVVVILFVFISIANAYKKRVGKAPKGMQSLFEPIIIFVRDDIAKPQLGHRYKGFMPYLLTVFFFVWINNLMGIIPFFPGGANLTGNISVTAMLALCTFILTNVNGKKNYWGHVFTPHVPWWLYPLMIPVEIIGLFTKPIALMIRLFANITAGHILILSLLSLIFILKSVAAAGVAVPFVLFISVIELVVGFIQAFIFTILSALFIGMAVEEHAEH